MVRIANNNMVSYVVVMMELNAEKAEVATKRWNFNKHYNKRKRQVARLVKIKHLKPELNYFMPQLEIKVCETVIFVKITHRAFVKPDKEKKKGISLHCL